MKIIKSLFFAFVATLMLAGCIENEPKVWTGAQVEFDAAVWNNPALGVTYPILVRQPAYGAPVASSNPSINRSSGTVTLRVNFLSKQSASEQVIGVQAVATSTTAVSGTHYTLPASITIPANSSFGELPITILDPGATSGSVDLVLELTGNTQVTPSANYKTVAIRIAQN